MGACSEYSSREGLLSFAFTLSVLRLRWVADKSRKKGDRGAGTGGLGT